MGFLIIMNQQNNIDKLIAVINKLLFIILILVLTIVIVIFKIYENNNPGMAELKKTDIVSNTKNDTVDYWKPKDINLITDQSLKVKVEYGRDLIAHTAKYLGPQGTVMKITNGLNCQNCHLQAGTVIFGNNYGSVNSLYPKFRARSGSIENVYKRVNDCIQRSLNGMAIDTNGIEMQAIAAYINYIGSNVEKGKKASGSGFKDLAFLDRAADPIKGKTIYEAQCQSCHQPDGQGLLNKEKNEFIYPALWGEHSFNDGAGLYRISNFAKYVKYNMPQGTTFRSPQLTDDESWDVAAFVVSQSRPHKNVPMDWPDLSKKPVDHPFGPYVDPFKELQHKYGPFKPIVDEKKKSEELLKSKNKTEVIK